MENINLIRKVAWNFTQTTKLEFDDLFQEAAYAYCKALDTYNPDKGAISTHVFVCMQNHLKNYIKKQIKDEVYIEDLGYSIDKPEETFEDILEQLSPTASDMVEIILGNVGDYIFTTQKKAKQKLVSNLKNSKWSRKNIWSGISELKLMFN